MGSLVGDLRGLQLYVNVSGMHSWSCFFEPLSAAFWGYSLITIYILLLRSSPSRQHSRGYTVEGLGEEERQENTEI